MNTRQATALLQPYLSLLVPEVRREMTVVTPQTLGTPYLLHISKDTDLARFVPGVTRRGMKKEDRTVARVSTSPCLMGCLLAYNSDMFDFHERKPGLKFGEARSVPFKGGYAIYGFQFDVAVRPTRKLVPDVEQTDEHWLLPYDERHTAYQPETLGKVFYSSVAYEVWEGRAVPRIEMYVEVLTEQPIWLDGRQKLTKGCWRITMTDLHRSVKWNEVRGLTIEEISNSDYTAVKRNVASMLSFESYAPASARW
jgi:hypothetical protein